MTADRIAVALDQACLVAASDFEDAVSLLRPALSGAGTADVLHCIARQWSVPDPAAIACSIYLISRSHSADLAAAAGWHALKLGCEDDQVIIATADVLGQQARALKSPAALMDRPGLEHRSTTYISKLADHYRTGGQAYMVEDMLHDMVRRGRADLKVRLAEHWVEFHDWRAARELLQQLSPEQVTDYTLYLLGRSCVGLLLEDELIAVIERLSSLPAPAPSYAALLESVWTWRVGTPQAAIASCPAGPFPPLIDRDGEQLLEARNSRSTDGHPVRAKGSWRMAGSQDDLPNVLGIGMQRTATSWLWSQLRRHPDVHALTFKEPVFFNDFFRRFDEVPGELRDVDVGDAALRYWQGPTRNLGDYRALFASDKPIRLDLSPSYAELPEASVAVARELLGEDTRILLSVRDPIYRSWSNLKLDLKIVGRPVSDTPFEERVALYNSVATRRRSDYVQVVRTWKRYFTHLHIVFMDSVVADPAAVLSDVSQFIGLSTPIQDCLPPVNATDAADMPREDRSFLFGLHQPTFADAEAELGGPALNWRRRHLELLG